MAKEMTVRLVLIGLGLLVGFGLAEVGVRLVGTTDESGQFYFQGRPILPYVIPTGTTRRRIAEYKKNVANARYLYDAELGWVPQPNYQNPNTGEVINSAGIRSDREYDLEPADDTLRIALFGDSFTYDAEVPNVESWAYHLEQHLLDRGIRAEVLNFGVSGYGIDQAYLRWQAIGQAYQPDMVLFGLVLKDAERNVNVMRPLLNPNTSVPFSKPRFVFDGNDLQLINSPTIPLDEIVDTLRNFHNHPLRQYEYFYDRRYDYKWWLNSKFLALIYDVLTADRDRSVSDPEEMVVTSREIIRQFADDVQQEGGTFIVAYLPEEKSLAISDDARRKFLYLNVYDLLPELEAGNVFFNGEGLFAEMDETYFAEGGHYSAYTDALMGVFLADEIVDCIDVGLCALSRFEDEAFRLD